MSEGPGLPFARGTGRRILKGVQSFLGQTPIGERLSEGLRRVRDELLVPPPDPPAGPPQMPARARIGEGWRLVGTPEGWLERVPDAGPGASDDDARVVLRRLMLEHLEGERSPAVLCPEPRRVVMKPLPRWNPNLPWLPQVAVRVVSLTDPKKGYRWTWGLEASLAVIRRPYLLRMDLARVQPIQWRTVEESLEPREGHKAAELAPNPWVQGPARLESVGTMSVGMPSGE